MHAGRIAQDFTGARERRLRVDDLLEDIEQVRNTDLLEDSAAETPYRDYASHAPQLRRRAMSPRVVEPAWRGREHRVRIS